MGTPSYCFSDSIDMFEYGMSEKLTLLVSSDDPAHYKEWRKKVTSHTAIVKGISVGCGKQLNMPLFDWLEMEQISPSSMDPKVRQFRFDVVDGIARLFLSPGDFSGNEEIEKMVGVALDKFFAGSSINSSAHWKDCRIWAVNTIGQSLIKCTDENMANLVFNSLFKCIDVDTKSYKAVGKKWTSVLLKHIAGMIMEEKESNVLAQIRAIFQNSGMGFMFEYAAHRKFCNSSSSRWIGVLDEKSTRSISMHVNKVVLLRTIDDIAKLKKVSMDCLQHQISHWLMLCLTTYSLIIRLDASTKVLWTS